MGWESAIIRVIGVPKEIKDQEGRVSMQPDGVSELAHHGHEAIVESGAGMGAGFTDEEYETAGAKLVDSPDELFVASDLIVKVKEPVEEEYHRFRDNQLSLKTASARSAPSSVTSQSLCPMSRRTRCSRSSLDLTVRWRFSSTV